LTTKPGASPQRIGSFRIAWAKLLAACAVSAEVSSPSTRRLELVRKRELYERFGVPGYWFVDLDADRLEVYRLDEQARYGPPRLWARAETFESLEVPGFRLAVDDILGPADED